MRFALTLALALLLTLLSAAPAAAADSVESLLTGYSVESWTQKDGLPSGTISALAQDKAGFLWIGSDAGLLRFDGLRFRPWDDASSPTPLPRAAVHALLAASDGSLWVGFGAYGGVARIRQDHVDIYSEAQGLPPIAITALVEEAGTIWLAGNAGLYRFIANSWRQVATEAGLSTPGPVSTAYVDRVGALWVATNDGVFRRRRDATSFESVERLEGSLADNLVRAIGEDRSGRIYLADFKTGFRRLGENGAARPGGQARARRLLGDRQGNLWVGTWGEGLWKVSDLHHARPRTETITAQTGLAAEGTFSLLEDRDGNIWAGSIDGLNRLTPHRMSRITDLGIVSGAQASADGTIWIGTFTGVIEHPRGDQRRRRAYLRGTRILAMHAEGTRSLLAATPAGLFRLENGGTGAVSGAEGLLQINSVTTDGRGAIWLYDLNEGLVRIEAAAARIPLPSELRVTQVVSLFSDRDHRMWACFANGSVAMADGNTLTVVRPRDRDSASISGCAIHQDQRGLVWMAGTAGLSWLAGEHFQQLQGPTRLKGLTEDANGALWLTGESGLIHVTRSELTRVMANPGSPFAFNQYDKSDGVAGTPRWSGPRSAIRVRGGDLWFVTGEGITIVHPTSLPPVPTVVPVRVERLRADDRALTAAGRQALRAGTRSIEIEYSALTLTTPHKTRFRYQLEGFDSDWIDAGVRRQAFYTNLGPGEYRFHVSSGQDGRWSAPTTALEFSVLPQFYQTWWFLPAVALTVAVAGLVSWRVRMRRIRHHFALVIGERVRLSREIHDTLLQGLVGVAMQFELLSNAADSPQSKARFTRMRGLVESYIRQARQSIANLRGAAATDNDLSVALRKTIEDITPFDSGGVSFEIQGTPSPLDANVEAQLLHIGREAVTNAIRHGGGSRIHVELRYDANGSVAMKVSDNGTGFDPTLATRDDSGHVGLASMQERATEIGGVTRIETAPGHGTIVETVVPTAARVAAW